MMCTLSLSPENQRGQLQLAGVERPPTKRPHVCCSRMELVHPPVHAGLIHPSARGSSCPALTFVCPPTSSFVSHQTPVSSHRETPPTLTDKSPLLGFIPMQLHRAALAVRGSPGVCVSAPPVTPDTAGDPNTADPHCELCPGQEGQAHSQSQALRYTLNLDSSREESSWAGGARQSPRVERKRTRRQ